MADIFGLDQRNGRLMIHRILRPMNPQGKRTEEVLGLTIDSSVLPPTNISVFWNENDISSNTIEVRALCNRIEAGLAKGKAGYKSVVLRRYSAALSQTPDKPSLTSDEVSRVYVTAALVNFFHAKKRQNAPSKPKDSIEALSADIGISSSELAQILAVTESNTRVLNAQTLQRLRERYTSEWIDALLDLPVTVSEGTPAEQQAALARAGRVRRYVTFIRLLEDSALFETLKELYSKKRQNDLLNRELFTFNGHRTPLIVVEAHPKQWKNLMTPLLPQIDSTDLPSKVDYPRDFDEAFKQSFLEEVSRLRQSSEDGEIWSDPTFTMQEIVKEEESLKLRCGLGRYLLATNTCDALEDELLEKQMSRFGSTLPESSLPRRKWLDDCMTTRSACEVGLNRSAAIAISTLTVFAHPTPDQYNVFLQHRSFSVRKHAGLAHVVPSGMFGPVVSPKSPTNEYSIRHNVLREFYEELFNEEEAAHSESEIEHDWFYLKKPIVRLEEMLTSPNPKEKAELLYTGLAINLMNLRPEICTVLIIRDHTWFRKALAGEFGGEKFKLSKLEFDPRPIPDDLYNELVLYDFRGRVQLGDRLTLPIPLHPKHLVPPASAAIKLGLRVARERLGFGKIAD